MSLIVLESAEEKQPLIVAVFVLVGLLDLRLTI